MKAMYLVEYSDLVGCHEWEIKTAEEYLEGVNSKLIESNHFKHARIKQLQYRIGKKILLPLKENNYHIEDLTAEIIEVHPISLSYEIKKGEELIINGCYRVKLSQPIMWQHNGEDGERLQDDFVCYYK
jgi:hypothetical protein